MPWPLLPAIRIPGFSNAFYNATDLSIYQRWLLSPLRTYAYVRIPRDSWEKREREGEVLGNIAGFSVAFTPTWHCSRPSTRYCGTIADWGCTIDAGCMHADSS